MTRPATAPRAPTQRSAVTNGSRLLAGVNGCSAMARRYRDLVDELTAEFNPATPSEHLDVRNAAILQLHAEDLSARLVRGEVLEPDAITRATNGATRALAGLKGRRQHRRAKEHASPLAGYLAEKQGSAAA